MQMTLSLNVDSVDNDESETLQKDELLHVCVMSKK